MEYFDDPRFYESFNYNTLDIVSFAEIFSERIDW